MTFPKLRIYIGGPSQAGKTTFSQELINCLEKSVRSVKVVELDKVSGMDVAQEKNDADEQKRLAKAAINKDFCADIAIYEGSMLWPEDLNDIDVFPIFLGYPCVTAEQKYNQIKSNGFKNADHLKGDKCEAICKLIDWIKDSKKLRDFCNGKYLFFAPTDPCSWDEDCYQPGKDPFKQAIENCVNKTIETLKDRLACAKLDT